MFVVNASILTGICFLAASFAPVFRLLRMTRSPGLRRAWISLALMIALFIVGYTVLLYLLPGVRDLLLQRVICVVLFAGSVFVLIVANLSARTASDIARLAKLERDVIVDPLTGSFNRRYFDERLASEIADAARTDQTLCLLVIDIDRFKSVNDAMGHAVGDRVLSMVAHLLSHELGPEDVLARYGGEEFAVIAPLRDRRDGVALAERLCWIVRENPVATRGGALRVTISVGVAMLQAPETPEALFARADAALYAAKSAGRDRVAFGEAGQVPIGRIDAA